MTSACRMKLRKLGSLTSVRQTSEYVQIDAQDQNWSKIKFRPGLPVDYCIE